MSPFDNRGRISLRAALSRDWPWLIGAVVYPLYLLLAERLLSAPVGIRPLLFITCFLPAAWPCIGKDAPYSFWICAIGVLLVSLTLATVINPFLGPNLRWSGP
jgi:hypothetical protein